MELNPAGSESAAGAALGARSKLGTEMRKWQPWLESRETWEFTPRRSSGTNQVCAFDLELEF